MASISHRDATPVALARRWVQDYFNRHDAEAARQFIAPGYTLNIGEHVFAGRDTAWLPAVDQQFALFPGLTMTVHDLITQGDRVAVWFSEHGMSRGRAAVWSGVGIYRGDGPLLTGCVAQEDYLTRQRQLKSGIVDPVDPAAAAPWDTRPEAPDPVAEEVVRRWVGTAWPKPPTAVRCDDDAITGTELSFDVRTTTFSELFSSGDQVAFHARQVGTYRGGLSGIAPDGRETTLNVNGLLRVRGGQVTEGRVIRDRLDLRGRLLEGGAR